MTPSRIHRLTLTHFRNYRAAGVEARGDMVVLVGPNGAGKTNCLEAISFLSPGRGLRRATLEDVADNQGDGSWAVSAEVEGALGLATLGTGIDAPHGEVAGGHQPALPHRPRAGDVGDSLRRSFAHGVADASDGRAVHGRGIGAAAILRSPGARHRQRAFEPGRRRWTARLRSRNRLLEVRNYDDHWCDAIERETAELAVAVAATRGQTATRLAAMLRARGEASAFPSAEIMLDGWMENALLSEPATAVEDRYRASCVTAARATPPRAAPSTARISPTFR